ncbi:hypothetical protein [Ponticoccus litoralis]|uniref:Uncharacterized protein n=1 Tax=Ponticoccus litoralis TaxID=422297 RepID=A0AAW9SLS2_9RHOB
MIAPDNHAHALAPVPVARLQEAMRQSIRHINRNDPTMPELVDYLWWLQGEMLREVAGTDDRHGGGLAHATDGYEPEYTPDPEAGASDLSPDEPGAVTDPVEPGVAF